MLPTIVNKMPVLFIYRCFCFLFQWLWISLYLSCCKILYDFFFAHPSKMYGSFQLEFLLHVFLLCVLADLTLHLGLFWGHGMVDHLLCVEEDILSWIYESTSWSFKNFFCSLNYLYVQRSLLDCLSPHHTRWLALSAWCIPVWKSGWFFKKMGTKASFFWRLLLWLN